MGLDDHADSTDEPDEPAKTEPTADDMQRREEARKPLEIPKEVAVGATFVLTFLNLLGQALGDLVPVADSMERPEAKTVQPAPPESNGPFAQPADRPGEPPEVPEPAEEVRFEPETEGKLTEDEPDDDERTDMEIRDGADQAEDLVDQDVDNTDAVDDDPDTRPWDDSDASSRDDADLDDLENRPDDYSTVPADTSSEPIAGLETNINTVPMRRDIQPDVDDRPAPPEVTEPPPSGGDTDDQHEVGEIQLPGH